MKTHNIVTIKLQNYITTHSKTLDTLFDKWISNRNGIIPNICSCCHCVTYNLTAGCYKIDNDNYIAPICFECLEKEDNLDIDINQLVKL